MSASGLRPVALAFLAVGTVLALAGLALVLRQASNTPPVFVLMIGGGLILGLLGLILLPFSRGHTRVPAAERPPEPAAEKSVAAPVVSTLAVVLTAVFIVTIGLVVGFFYLIHRWFGDWNLW